MPTDIEALRQSLIQRLVIIDKIDRDPELQAIAIGRERPKTSLVVQHLLLDV